MFTHSKHIKVTLATASAILAAASVAPAAAEEHPAPANTAHGHPGEHHHPRGDHRDHRNQGRDHDGRRHQPEHNWRHDFQGRVIAHGGLNVREMPTTHSRIVGLNAEGSLVSIHCKVNGEWIKGNPRWYKLTGKTHGWSSARYILNVGPAPEWCHDHNEHGRDQQHRDEHGKHDHEHGHGEHGGDEHHGDS
ncbi:SH3 domain-containing protein [Streptomyces sp. NPDC054933]